MATKAEIKKELYYSFDAYFDYVVQQAKRTKEKAPYHGFLALRKDEKPKRTFYLL